MNENTHKLPRLYVTAPLSAGKNFELDEAQTHYVKNVMRRKEGEQIRCFNGRDGEFTARIETVKKRAVELSAQSQIKTQPPENPKIHLLFAPLKKHRMDQVIEKTVELGVTDLHPVITAHTEVRDLNAERLTAQIIEAAEQSERLDVPTLHPIKDLKSKMAAWDKALPLYWGAETKKDEALMLTQSLKASAFLIGPVGGFDTGECEYLAALPFIKPVSLGPRVLRAETAAIFCLVLANP
jgi:16S rRNA (uracil1498-N3)-methyltransferase